MTKKKKLKKNAITTKQSPAALTERTWMENSLLTPGLETECNSWAPKCTWCHQKVWSELLTPCHTAGSGLQGPGRAPPIHQKPNYTSREKNIPSWSQRWTEAAREHRIYTNTVQIKSDLISFQTHWRYQQIRYAFQALGILLLCHTILSINLSDFILKQSPKPIQGYLGPFNHSNSLKFLLTGMSTIFLRFFPISIPPSCRCRLSPPNSRHFPQLSSSRERGKAATKAVRLLKSRSSSGHSSLSLSTVEGDDTLP